MNTRQRRKTLKQRVKDPDVLIRLDAKSDLVLEQLECMNRRTALIGAVSGGITGGIVGGAVAFAVAYAKAMLLGVR